MLRKGEIGGTVYAFCVNARALSMPPVHFVSLPPLIPVVTAVSLSFVVH